MALEEPLDPPVSTHTSWVQVASSPGSGTAAWVLCNPGTELDVPLPGASNQGDGGEGQQQEDTRLVHLRLHVFNNQISAQLLAAPLPAVSAPGPRGVAAGCGAAGGWAGPRKVSGSGWGMGPRGADESEGGAATELGGPSNPCSYPCSFPEQSSSLELRRSSQVWH